MTQYTNDIKEAIRVLKSGGTLIYPTDTIWGIGCDATNEKAVQQVYRIKQREESKALIILVDSVQMMERYLTEIPELAYQLIDYAEKPLTLILEGPRFLAANLYAADNTIAIRVARDEFCRDLIGQFRRPIVSTSANISGKASPANFSEIDPTLLEQVDYTVQYRQNDRSKSVASTIIKLGLNNEIKIIRK